MAEQILHRRSPLHGSALPTRVGILSVTETEPMARFVYRGPADALGDAFGVTLPTVPLRAESANDRVALWLGPDEWLLLAPEGEGHDVLTALTAALGSLPSSVVDISHRQIGLDIIGPSAADLLAAGCPLDLDLSAFPVGMCTRTLLAKVEVILWRCASDDFHLEVQGSFAPYVAAVLCEATRDLD